MRHTLHILTLTVFLLSIIAPACGFAWNGAYSVIEICTADGYESRIVANDQEPNTPDHDIADQCQFCFANAHLTSIIPNVTPLTKLQAYALKLQYALYEVNVQTRLTSHEQPRGSPSLV